jgi:hypothetical protein
VPGLVFRVFALIGLGVALWAVTLVIASHGEALAAFVVYALGACAVWLALEAMR